MSLELRSVTKSFGENTLFRDFSYAFPNTGSYVLKGDSGTGKTTFLRMCIIKNLLCLELANVIADKTRYIRILSRVINASAY